MWTDVIQVEIVGKQWWDDLLPIAAILISLVSIWYTWWARHTDKATLTVRATSFATDRGTHQMNIGVLATNKGLTGSAVVDGVHLQIARRTYAHTTGSLERTAVLPMTVAPDATMTYVVSSKGLAKELVAHKRKPRQAVPVVTTGRRKYRGKFDTAGMEVLTADYNAAKEAFGKANPKRGWRERVLRRWSHGWGEWYALPAARSG